MSLYVETFPSDRPTILSTCVFAHVNWKNTFTFTHTLPGNGIKEMNTPNKGVSYLKVHIGVQR